MIDDIIKSVEILRGGGVILYPTDTIWGIGCDATNPEAVDRIYRLKKRSDRKSMLVLMKNESWLYQYIKQIPEIAWQLIEVSDKPLTIIYPGAKNLASNLVAENGSIGIRIPNDEFCIKLLNRFRKPIVSTSANVSGQNAPAYFQEITPEIKDGVDYIVCWKQNDKIKSSPSSVIELGLGGVIRVIRK
jgi:L-threonylcarbamoyladenylate synthase